SKDYEHNGPKKKSNSTWIRLILASLRSPSPPDSTGQLGLHKQKYPFNIAVNLINFNVQNKLFPFE
ncbi:MAG TPA: hypothetical protein VK609_04120, partial [Mucilaginibacter sp.]|nr:hypothetical protein [Mucilaginibacter sp.]